MGDQTTSSPAILYSFLKMLIQGLGRLCVTTEHPAPAGADGYYFEITLQEGEGFSDEPYVYILVVCETPKLTSLSRVIGVGFSTMPATSELRFPGWPSRAQNIISWAHHGDDGGFYSSEKNGYTASDESWDSGDTIGCGVDYNTGTMFWTRNGEKLGESLHSGRSRPKAFANYLAEYTFQNIKGRLFPVIGFEDKTPVIVNLGNDLDNKPFKWDGKEKPQVADETAAEEKATAENGTETEGTSEPARANTV